MGLDFNTATFLNVSSPASHLPTLEGLSPNGFHDTYFDSPPAGLDVFSAAMPQPNQLAWNKVGTAHSQLLQKSSPFLASTTAQEDPSPAPQSVVEVDLSEIIIFGITVCYAGILTLATVKCGLAGIREYFDNRAEARDFAEWKKQVDTLPQLLVRARIELSQHALGPENCDDAVGLFLTLDEYLDSQRFPESAGTWTNVFHRAPVMSVLRLYAKAIDRRITEIQMQIQVCQDANEKKILLQELDTYACTTENSVRFVDKDLYSYRLRYLRQWLS